MKLLLVDTKTTECLLHFIVITAISFIFMFYDYLIILNSKWTQNNNSLCINSPPCDKFASDTELKVCFHPSYRTFFIQTLAFAAIYWFDLDCPLMQGFTKPFSQQSFQFDTLKTSVVCLSALRGETCFHFKTHLI